MGWCSLSFFRSTPVEEARHSMAFSWLFTGLKNLQKVPFEESQTTILFALWKAKYFSKQNNHEENIFKKRFDFQVLWGNCMYDVLIALFFILKALSYSLQLGVKYFYSHFFIIGAYSVPYYTLLGACVLYSLYCYLSQSRSAPFLTFWPILTIWLECKKFYILTKCHILCENFWNFNCIVRMTEMELIRLI